MKLTRLQLRNFRCFENVDIQLHDEFNIIVGVNGTGKTALLEAMRIAVGSLFLKVDKYKDKISSPSILNDDVRLHNLEQQFPVVVSAEGKINSFMTHSDDYVEMSWERSLEKRGGKTRSMNAVAMSDASMAMQESIRNANAADTIPLVAYYSTDRFKKEKRDVHIEPEGSRLRGYYNALDSMTNTKFFLDLWYTETLDQIQKGYVSPMLIGVSEAIRKCITDCENVYFDIKQQELIFVLSTTHEKLPFHVLSDGVRSMLAMVMEIAFRCYLLNPHLAEMAPVETSGVVLIDEIDLHLHPEWQMRVVNDLCSAFPKIQFIVSTHAPLVIGSLTNGSIYSISENQVYDFPLQHGKDANHILREMGSDEMDRAIKDRIERYLLMIEKGEGRSEQARMIRQELETVLGSNHTELQRADIMLGFFSN